MSTTVDSGSTKAIVQCTVGENDTFRIVAGGATNEGWVEIATGDDANEPIYVRQYMHKGSDMFNSIARTLTLLDGSGNTQFPGTVTATTAVLNGNAFCRNVDNDYLAIEGGSGYRKGARLTLIGKDVDSNEKGRFQLYTDDGTIRFVLYGSADGSLAWNGTMLHPSIDNSCSLGLSARRWSTIYAATGTINTSDSRLKNSVKDIDDALLDAWGNIEPKQYKFNDATEKKGEQARYHTGYLAQDIQSECEKQGVNASDYGLFCYDEWEEQEEILEENETEKDGKKVKEKYVIQPKCEKGDAYSLRYEEALVVECAYLRREISRLKEELKQLKAK